MPSYSSEVRRFGGPTPYVNCEGQKQNLDHSIKFSSEDLTTDGQGNVLDMPLLKRKPCFGRPERFVRGAWEQVPEWRNPSGQPNLRLTKCETCPVVFACSDVCMERIESNPKIERAAVAWFDATDGLADRNRFAGSRNTRLWESFLRAIILQGKWSNVNDARVSASQVQKTQDRDEKRRIDAKKKRRANRLKAPRIQPSTPEFEDAVNAENDRRLAVLLDLRSQSDVPRWISKLTERGCEQTVAVWRSQTTLVRAGHKATGEAIADWLLRHGQGQYAKSASLRTAVYRCLERVKKLEDTRAGNPIWAKFEWKS